MSLAFMKCYSCKRKIIFKAFKQIFQMVDFVSTLIILLALVVIYRRFSCGQRCALVIVQGDLGRSPRMLYHTLSLLNRGYQVNLMGYVDSPLIPEILHFKTLKVIGLTTPLSRSSSRLSYVYKALQQMFYLALGFLKCDKPSVVILQNPPSIPTMAICAIFRYIYGYVLIFDWHNYGYTLLGIALGSTANALYEISKKYEKFCAQFSDFNFCVSKAMQKDLHENWDIRSTVLYDKAPQRFRELKGSDRTDFLKSQPYLEDVVDDFDAGSSKRAMLVVSSTSWTEDEDFSILLEALVKYDKTVSTSSNSEKSYPKLVCVITGKGPLKNFYLEKIKKLSLENYVTIRTPWLEAEDYPKLIGCADLGICLHTSSSGLDLPMKVVDMYGCNLPVCAVKYNCISELVEHEQTGLLFQNAEQLLKHLMRIAVTEYGNTNNVLNRMRSNLRKINDHRWDQEWDEKAWPIIKTAN